MEFQGLNNPVELYSGTYWEAGLLKSMLDDAGIYSFLTDTIMGVYISPTGVRAVRVFVSESDYEKASATLREFEENLRDEVSKAED
jgi:hypothetical protein